MRDLEPRREAHGRQASESDGEERRTVCRICEAVVEAADLAAWSEFEKPVEQGPFSAMRAPPASASQKRAWRSRNGGRFDHRRSRRGETFEGACFDCGSSLEPQAQRNCPKPDRRKASGWKDCGLRSLPPAARSEFSSPSRGDTIKPFAQIKAPTNASRKATKTAMKYLRPRLSVGRTEGGFWFIPMVPCRDAAADPPITDPPFRRAT